jgi:urease accessory protein
MTDLIHATNCVPAGQWPSAKQTASVTLSYADRCRRRIRLTDDAGKPFLLNLEKPQRLADGDGLALTDGSFVRVTAATEKLLEVQGQDAAHLARLAWHVGNRHTAAEIVDARTLRLVNDAVLRDMLMGLGATLALVEAPFHPEGGAYGGHVATGHGHHHQDDHHHDDHDHAHGHRHHHHS